MSKNYFTDGQILKLIFDKFKADGVDMRNIDNIPSEQEIKDLKQFANLAVEAAIGEKVGFLIKHFDGEYELDFNETWQKVKEQLPLYSVKELEN